MPEKKEILITKHNALVEASYKLTLNEQRLILFCISKIDPRKPLAKDNSFTISASEFSETFGIDEKNAYKELEKASKTLSERWIKTYKHGEKEKFRWIFGMIYHKNEGKLTLGFSPWIEPYLTKLYKQFTSYKLAQVSKLKSIYSIRLFEFINQFKKTGKLSIDIEKFKERLELKSGYSRFYNLKKRVIEPAVKELSEKSNISIDWKPIKSGRNTKQLEFTFYEKKLRKEEN
ncbi:replication initiation protein [Shewanella vesiculosa]|uniref:replication initiation protein n=1 Tax=Shewanella vesiculosa TaxID=518738 RepID=UPI001D5406C8|nr:replication initiation protein [Shewanella vesiculosa]NCQ40296.1 replication initiation protein [Shewanella vesiculosa]